MENYDLSRFDSNRNGAGVRKTQNRKQGEAPGEIWEIPKETGETLGETRGNVWGNGGKHVGNSHQPDF